MKRTALSAAILTALPLYADAGEITIKRDTWGVPHVYADTTHDLFYGYGHSVAQDRLYQMEISKRSTQGRMAEILGTDYVEYDKKIRTNYDPLSIQRQIDALDTDDRAILDGYAKGMNAWIRQVLAQQDTLLPKQFSDNDFLPEEWTAFDVAMIFVGSLGNRFGDYNTEIENQQLLDALIETHGENNGWNIFNQLNPLNDSTAPTTIPKSDWSGTFDPRHPELTKRPAISDKTQQDIARLATGQDGAILGLSHNEARRYNEQQFHDYGLTGVAGYPQTSNMIVVGKKKAKGVNSILLNGPQFGWYNPAYTYSIGLHGAGFNVVGNTPFAYPSILFGNNEHIAWGSTWGAGDLVDIYRESLNPDNPEEYLFQGRYRPMETRTETIRVKNAEAVTVKIHKTVHGLLVSHDAENGIAYAKKRAWQGRELATLIAWTRQGQAKDHPEWLQQASRSALNINWYYADQAGNIGYVFAGKYPERKPGHDNRLPASGTGDQEWLGIKPFHRNPQVYNPSSGYIANWNNKPADDFLAPDMYWYSWSEADRVDTMTAIMESKDRFTPEDVKQMMEDVSYADVNARYFIPFLDDATRSLPKDDERRQAVALLREWAQTSHDKDRDGYYDEAATTLFQAWLPDMLALTFKDDLPGDFFNWYASAGYPSPESPLRSSLNVQPGTKALLQALRGSDAGVQQDYDFFNGHPADELILASLDSALNKVKQAHGDSAANWKLPVVPMRFFTNNFLGMPQAGSDEEKQTHIAMNRGTENNLVIFNGRKVESHEVVPPGQSGFIAPDGTPSPHYEDQLKLFENFEYKRTWLMPEQVDANTQSTLRLLTE
ncbi:penicillin acylase family protein [Marinobacterium sp. 3-1745]|uniref:Penicillin acylase family protein n=1 Tax=Marinobacterium marinum TaxID=2756129 RepID=A0A7W2A9P2_9GAMM|nr:penicillin acylase family protein [Marinobacterium marinum]